MRCSRPHGETMGEEDQVHFKMDSRTLLWILWLVFKLRHLGTARYSAAVQHQPRVLNTTRQVLSAPYVARWYQHGAAATESVPRRALSELGWGIVHVMVEFHQQARRSTLQLPWEKWGDTVPGKDVIVYLGTGARQDPYEGCGCGVGVVTTIRDKCRGAAVPLETWVVETTAQVLGVVLGRYVVERLSNLIAWLV